MLARMDGSLGEHHAGELHNELAQAKAERILARELQRRGWKERELANPPGNMSNRMTNEPDYG